MQSIAMVPSSSGFPTSAWPAELSDVWKRYGKVEALRGVSLHLAPGELVALLGANGAGKTTAVRMLLGLAAPTSGTASVFGLNPREPENRVRSGAMLQVGQVPQTLRVREHLELFASYYPNPMVLEDAVQAAGLTGLEQRLFGELSGGQKQRALFALAIIGNPDLLVLDEPTAALDVEARRSMWNEIRRFKARGTSILLTTHHLEEADALADRIIVLDRGAVVAEGTPSQIKARTAGRRIRCHTGLDLEGIAAIPGVTSVRNDGNVVEILATVAEPVIRELLSRDTGTSNLEVTGAGLEEAFLNLTTTSKETLS